MQARHYRPEVARFLTRDRYESSGLDLNLESDPLTNNMYAFAGGNPVNRVEWDGHFAQRGIDGRCYRNGLKGPVYTDRTCHGEKLYNPLTEQFSKSKSRSGGEALPKPQLTQQHTVAQTTPTGPAGAVGSTPGVDVRDTFLDRALVEMFKLAVGDPKTCGIGGKLKVGECSLTILGLIPVGKVTKLSHLRQLGHGVDKADDIRDVGRGARVMSAVEVRKLLGSPSDVVVIGRTWDTAAARNWPGHVVLNTPNWSKPLNDAWISEAIKQRRRIYLASPTRGNLVQRAGEYKGRPTVFAEELKALNNAGYTRRGDYLEPPL